VPPVEVEDRAVEAMLARWFPGRDVSCARIGAGVSTPVYRVTVGGEVSWLRLAEQPGERRDTEVRVHELVRELGIAGPEVIRWEREPPELDRSAALTSHLPGIPLVDSVGDPSAALQRAGRDLARFNAIPVRGWGWVRRIDPDGGLVAAHPTRAAWAVEYLAAGETVRERLPQALGDRLEVAIRAWAGLPGDEPAHLAHGDFDPSHIYVDPEDGSYQGMIDFGEIRGADRAYDLGHLLIHAGPATCDAALAGYAEVTPDAYGEIRLQAIAIAARALAIQLGRPPNGYREMLRERLVDVLGPGH